MLPQSLSTALKEWKIVVDAMLAGRQILLLRKGGIIESGGEFQLEHRQFVFFPTYVHQDLRMLKPVAQTGFRSHSAEPQRIELAAAGEVTDILPVQHRSQIDALRDEHVWAEPLIDMRFSYKPQNPLYVLVVRTYRLAQPVTVENSVAYAGCKSWVPLAHSVACDNAAPALDAANFEAKRDRILRVLARIV